MSIQQHTWASRGQALYEVIVGAAPPALLSREDARAVVAVRLRASLRGLSEPEHEAAVTAAAHGYMQAHRNKGNLVGIVPTVGRRGPLERVLATVLPPLDRPVAAQKVRRQVVSPATTHFLVTQGHAVMKGMTGGRVRIPRGETAIGAVSKRITRDTGCEVVAIREDEARGAEGPRTGRHYWLTLRGRDRPRSAGGGVVEAAVQVRL